MNISLLEVAMCEKCRNSYFQSEGGIKSLRTGRGVGLKNFRTGGVTDLGGLLLLRGQYPITSHVGEYALHNRSLGPEFYFRLKILNK